MKQVIMFIGFYIREFFRPLYISVINGRVLWCISNNRLDLRLSRKEK